VSTTQERTSLLLLHSTISVFARVICRWLSAANHAVATCRFMSNIKMRGQEGSGDGEGS